MYYSPDFLVCISIAPRNNVCGAREFSVKLGIFSETSSEITHFSPWITLVPTDRGTEYCDDPVCLSVCVFFSPRSYLRPIFTNFLCMLPMAVARSSPVGVVICTSGFMSDVIFAHKPRLPHVAAPAEEQCTRSVGLGYKQCKRMGLLFECLK